MAGLRSVLLLACLAGVAVAQIPSLGWCPEYVPMADFNMERYLGTWYEAERYFTVLEAGSRCVRSNYTKAVDGRVLVSNEITNRLTGIKRVVEGEIRNVVKGSESKLNVKYSTLPVNFETTYSVLDTDYDSYSVVWSCSSIGPLRTQNAWVMTRERLAPGTVLQMAYGVLDKYKISRTFFVKTDQADCAIAEAANQEREQAERRAALEKSASPIADPAAAPAAVAPVIVESFVPAAVPVEAIPIVNVVPPAASEIVADAPAPVVPAFVPIPIAMAEKVAVPAVPAVPVVAADPIAAPAAPVIAAEPVKEVAAEPAKEVPAPEQPAKAVPVDVSANKVH